MAITGTLTVSTEELQAQSGAVDTQIRQMRSNFDDLKQLVDGSAGYWVGQAGDAHRQLYHNHIAKIEEMLSRYSEHVVDLQTMAGIYVKAEEQSEGQAEGLPPSTL